MVEPFERFELRDEHITLLRSLRVTRNNDDATISVDFGEVYSFEPCLDVRRASDRLRIAQLLEFEYPPVHREDVSTERVDRVLTDQQKTACDQIFRELPTALQIVLAIGAFDPGEFQRIPHTPYWRRVTE